MIYMEFALFSLIVLLYWVITELFTIFFRLTGLPEEKARFQVISLLTGCGFTTRESEMMLTSRSRRRLARATMLFGYVFNITIVSAFVNVFLSLKISQVESYLPIVLIPMVTVILIILLIRSSVVRTWADVRLEKLADRMIHGKTAGNTVRPMDYIGKDAIALVTLRYIPEEHVGKSLSALGLRKETGILVMLVEPEGGKAEAAGPDTVFQVGDKLTVFGDYPTICRVFHARELFTED